MNFKKRLKFMHLVGTLLTASPIGAMPLAVIISDGQNEESYAKGFQMVLQITDGYGFYGKGSPKIIMTDDGLAERNALNQIFPEAILLLCIFHFLQAFWRWVLISQHGIDKSERQETFSALKKIVYSQENELDNAMTDFENLSTYKENDLLKEHYEDMMERIEYWCKFYRRDIITRRHDTNNFSEATMRIFKEVILGRCRVFNFVELVDYIFRDYEYYHMGRICDFISDLKEFIPFFQEPNRKIKVGQKYLPKNSIKASDISKSVEGNFIVLSQTNPGFTYEVNPNNCSCNCPAGQDGSICKHLVGIHLHTDATLFTFPPVTHLVNHHLQIIMALCPIWINYPQHLTLQHLTLQHLTRTISRCQINQFPAQRTIVVQIFLKHLWMTH
ncbi:unnamed protein product [Meganyctiphanes norvegica]|uniref:SWIM-type domain-containing protein n=1 Tax=Meganyctiphanes norvegica TaxID=48144 RepID=A0AAV2S8Y1_MEGNR